MRVTSENHDSWKGSRAFFVPGGALPLPSDLRDCEVFLPPVDETGTEHVPAHANGARVRGAGSCCQGVTGQGAPGSAEIPFSLMPVPSSSSQRWTNSSFPVQPAGRLPARPLRGGGARPGPEGSMEISQAASYRPCWSSA